LSRMKPVSLDKEIQIIKAHKLKRHFLLSPSVSGLRFVFQVIE